LTLKYLQAVVPKQADVDMVYVNCRNSNTSFRIFSELLQDERTIGFGLSEVYERFLEAYRRKTVLILDEVDLMSPKDKRREILYLLSRSEQPYMIIMLSNSPHVLKQLDAATRSSLQPMPLHFRNYDAPQIQAILTDRARRGLHECDSSRLAQIAALTTRLANSDARLAIKTLFYTIIRPGMNVEECFEAARRDLVVDLINDLADGNLMILWAAATARSDLIKEIFQRYQRFCQQKGEKPFSYVHFYSNLSYLQSLGLIALIATKVDRAWTNRVQLTFDASTAESIARLRFE
jgi:Cdc6-like AAA superfamily ATPase